ncbi:hypothetical protein BpHYR1_002505 [Brachionus plicatilis]|uniref:Uncharacterized protein n=1 Tax=Brachionus plicatilis TaxID=10195 RepID=A0A3M7Q6T3_BRAPC|nr:hypothetical protein BpHYR1_002505 [Brachionus plicatilis]
MENNQKFPISRNEYKNITDNCITVSEQSSFFNINAKPILSVFQTKIQECENLSFRLILIKKNAVLLTEKARDGTPHVRIDANCQLCSKQDGCKYTFNIFSKLNLNDSYIDVHWKKLREHNHNEPSKQQRGEKRVELCDILTNSDWYIRLKSVADAINLTNGNEHLSGYVGSLRDLPYYEMILLTPKQLNCIKSVSEMNRILYLDATGGLVKIPKNLEDNNSTQELSKSVMVAEYGTSRHDVFRISKPLYFRLIVIDYSWALIHSVLDELTKESPLDYAERVFNFAKDELNIVSN